MFPAALDDGDGVPQLSAGSGNITDSFAGAASASLTFQTDGDRIATTISGGAVDDGDWVTPKEISASINSQCTVRAHVDSETGAGLDASSPAEDTDHALSTERGFVVNQSGAGSSSATITFTMKFNGVTVQSVQRTLTATAS
jgi:hypothetical protein